MPRLRSLLCGLFSLAASACVGTTGSDLFFFDAAAAGPEDADPAAPLTFTTSRGYKVTLTRANVHIGAVYLNHALQVSGAQDTSCFLPGLYVAEVTGGLDVNALSPEPQPFPIKGEALSERALSAEVWLAGRDVTAVTDSPVILDIAGTAEKDGSEYPFDGALTIGQNRAIPSNDPSRPGKNPICKERIVSPIDITRDEITPRSGGRLLVRVDPRGFFRNVNFEELTKDAGAPIYHFKDVTDGQPNVNLYQGLKSRSGTYAFRWIDPPR